jgi:D-alanyl-lipoteichoic acid acyltransferase DltB (MBOAT superfamily)
LTVIIIFLILKSETLSTLLSGWLRRLQLQDYTLASPLDLRWLGFSYLAFRLLHVLRDHQLGNAYSYSLANFAIYALFFPTLTAGPIDRSGRFLKDLQAGTTISTQSLQQGGKRILLGAFQKFVLADSLALFALSSQNATQTTSPIWTWVMLYAYAMRIYFDFAGYTDIALGLGLWVGIRLPENFAAPYAKANLTSFWNSWHITLAQWFRAYFFNPLTRALRSSSRSIPVWLVILVGQVGTMLLIGLWHGVTWNFALWGLWHAAGLYFHNRWSEWARSGNRWMNWWSLHPNLSEWIGRIITFHYVTLSWVWFALPDPQLSLLVFKRLFSL